MNQHTFKLVLLSFLLIWSCQSSENKDSVINVSDQFTSYSLQLNPPKANWIDLIDKVKIVGLEETEESLLGKIDNLTITDDKIAYGRVGENTMFFFDRNGKFINKFNRKGDGPEEYATLWDYWLDDEVVRIHDPGHERVVDYSFSGEFIKETKLPYLATHAIGDDKQLWLDMTTGYAKDSIYARLVKYQPSTKEESYYLKQDKMDAFILQFNQSTFRRYKEDILFKEFLSDSVYLIQSGTSQPFMHFNFGEDYFWKGEALSYNIQEGMPEIQRAGKVWQIVSTIGEQMVYLKCFTNTSMRAYRSYLLNRQSGNQTELDFGKGADQTFSFDVHLWHENQLVISMSSSDVGELLKRLDEDQYSFEGEGSLESIESSENPVLIFVTFKNTLN